MMLPDDVPATDENVAQKFKEYRDQIMECAMNGIYQCRRKLGDNVLDAHIYTLRCHVDPTHPSLTPLK